MDGGTPPNYSFNFTHILTLFSVILFSELIFTQSYFPQAFPLLPNPLERISTSIEYEMCGHHCPFHPSICSILGFLDILIENYWVTIISLSIIARFLGNLPQNTVLVWFVVHVVSYAVMGIVLFSIFNVGLTTPFLCTPAQTILRYLFGKGGEQYFYWVDYLMNHIKGNYIEQCLSFIFNIWNRATVIVGLDKPFVYIICGLCTLFRRSYAFTTKSVVPNILIIFSISVFGILFNEVPFISAIVWTLFTYFVGHIGFLFFLHFGALLFLPIFAYSAFATACRLIPLLLLFGISEDLCNVATLAVFVWLMTWMYSWANSWTNLSAVLVIFFGITQIFSASIENIVFLFMLTELFTRPINPSV
ncbi:hypothetical protein EIN_229290 [Entamoeba invadens IP1]|uniref:Uncharacterized protein n=1 Tax=Entamoeba invadens IP1 TaxID=370355 RepID=A0A0A1U2W5_ENTIV|nr:hypothetical protein EIN_229290 [Entamoeba invadens IP1]ELP88406.1 hypothetical protein EIN_229290 [Entamoeba invadens IP1]|eukprot:XP_004255177.1 hypothetical protein EIN_229290 [Entamoeba invadens IP1]